MKLKSQKKHIQLKNRQIKVIVLSPIKKDKLYPGILWIHGGGFATGMKEMVHISRGKEIAKKFGAVVVSPGYRLSGKHSYPAAINDCYDTLLWMKNNAKTLGINSNQIIVGGESAGGGLTASLCMMAKDKGEVNIAFQLPLYPMLDCEETESNKDNKGICWNTKRNKKAWALYLKGVEKVNEYASASRRLDYNNLPPCYTFVVRGEPFYTETINYVESLKKSGIEAKVDVYEGKMHAFDMLLPFTKKSRLARKVLLENYEEMICKYFNKQND